jgi:hypothetical protein
MWIFWYLRNANSYWPLWNEIAEVILAHRAAEGVRCWVVNLSSPNVNDLRSGASAFALNACGSETAAYVNSRLTCTKSPRFGGGGVCVCVCVCVCFACWYGSTDYIGSVFVSQNGNLWEPISRKTKTTMARNVTDTTVRMTELRFRSSVVEYFVLCEEYR